MRPACTPPYMPLLLPLSHSPTFTCMWPCTAHSLDLASLGIPNTLSRHTSQKVNASLSKLCKHPIQVSAEVLEHYCCDMFT